MCRFDLFEAKVKPYTHQKSPKAKQLQLLTFFHCKRSTLALLLHFNQAIKTNPNMEAHSRGKIRQEPEEAHHLLSR